MTSTPLPTIIDSAPPNQYSAPRLPRSLSSLETWGFGVTAHISWPAIAPVLHIALGTGAIFVWLPGTILGILLNLQVKRLGRHFPDVAGGTPNYTTRLLKHYPGLARYAAVGYFFSWVSTLAINVVVLTELIKVNLEPLGITCPDTLVKIGLTLIAFILAFSGTRALSILHLFFVIPAIGLLLAFCLFGIGWLAISPASPGFFPSSWSPPSFVDWAKWLFFVTYTTYACESASAFVADSRRPDETLRFLSISCWIMPPIFLGGSWVLMRLATDPGLGSDTFLNLLAVSTPFWGQSAAIIVTFFLAAGSLLSCATVLSNCPRMLYQLATDGHLSPVFAVVSRRGVFGPALVLTLLFTFICLAWGDVARIAVVSNTGWFVSIMSVHLALWLRRKRPEVFLPWWSGVFFLLEVVVLAVGGLAWGWKDFLIGLLFPLGILAADQVIRRIRWAPFHAAWWIQHYRGRSQTKISDFVGFQVVILILLICSAATISWMFRARIGAVDLGQNGNNLYVVMLLIAAFVGVAIACWTSLPQVMAIVEAREQSEHLFNIAIDGILVVDEKGVIRQANPAAEQLLKAIAPNLLGCRLNHIFPALAGQPDNWSSRSEHTLKMPQHPTIVEAAVSNRFNQDFQEYVVLVRDITERQQAEEAVRNYSHTLEQKVDERTSELAHANAEILALNERLQADNIRMSAELAVTRRLQQMLLPKQQELESLPGLEIASFMEPAEEVGGDYYDVLNYEDKVKIGIGDVTGHGLESGVLTIMVQTAVRTLLENNETDPKRFLDVLNRTIYHNVQRMSSDKNLSLSLLDYQAGTLRLTGQHEEMIVVRSGGQVERMDTVDLGFPIGLEADITNFVAQIQLQLHSGDVVVLYTDGITEAENRFKVQYGLDRLCDIVSRNCQQTVEEIKQAVIEDLRRHIGEQKIYDDITLLILKQK
ncbi:SpoIIE family protein phosphatase [Coleofasciculus sp. FACHB-129]|uniref:SpoIIE family protein phosphatase n=1 Tax=Cyanophyceae TaxID=3028117 RepID=UPI001684F60B|nr:amino acid permease [Coleofasciculus sp. FACHB-129]